LEKQLESIKNDTQHIRNQLTGHFETARGDVLETQQVNNSLSLELARKEAEII